MISIRRALCSTVLEKGICGTWRRSVSAQARYGYNRKRRLARGGEYFMSGVCTADTYNLKLLPSIVRQSERFSLVSVHNDCRNQVMHVREALSDGESRNVFVFKFGAAVLWDLTDPDCTRQAHAVLNTLLRPIEQGSSYAEDGILNDLEKMDYVTSQSTKTYVRGETVVLGTGELSGSDSGQSGCVENQIAVSHALAKSVRLSTVEGQLEECADGCRGLLQSQDTVTKRDAWRKTLEALYLEAKANHPPIDMEDFYWERAELDRLHTLVLAVFDYNRRIAMFNQLLTCCKEFMSFHYKRTVSEKENQHTYWIVGLIFLSIALGHIPGPRYGPDDRPDMQAA